MKDTYYNKIVVLILIFCFGYALKAQEEVSKIIEKSYDLTNVGELQLENKYGNININGWDQNKIQIKINVIVNKKEKEYAQDLLNRIKPSISYSKEFISIFSYIEEKENGFFSKLLNRANPFDFDKGNIQINYDINLPINAEVQITNKFGDIFTNGWNGKLNTNIGHGNIWIQDNLTNASIEMKFGKLKAKSIAYGSIKIKNSELDIENSKNLSLNSSGSTIALKNISNLEIYSSKDKVTIRQVDKIRGELKFSNMILEEVSENIDLTMDVADFNAYKITKSNANIDIKQKSSEVHLNISDLNFYFNASLEQGLLRIPKSFTNINTTIIDKSKKLRNVTASYGNDTKGKIQIHGIKGVVILSEK
ncbi:hypothetical protein [Aquimarina addita]